MTTMKKSNIGTLRIIKYNNIGHIHMDTKAWPIGFDVSILQLDIHLLIIIINNNNSSIAIK